VSGARFLEGLTEPRKRARKVNGHRGQNRGGKLPPLGKDGSGETECGKKNVNENTKHISSGLGRMLYMKIKGWEILLGGELSWGTEEGNEGVL